MTDEKIALLELIEKSGDGDFVRELLGFAAERLMEVEVTARAGAAKGARSADRLVQRNGYRERAWGTRVGQIDLQIPKLRRGSYFPSFLEPRRTAERALAAVIQEAYVQGVSTRAVDDLVQAMGLAGISKSEVSRLCAELDERVGAFLERPIEGGVKRQVVLRDKATRRFTSWRRTWPHGIPLFDRRDHSLVPTRIDVGAARRGGP